ncbi:hypothetical protein L7F22_020321 [Adiantum nelumboides]|nr:hypothetical protein [Adiantum nelumboides]
MPTTTDTVKASQQRGASASASASGETLKANNIENPQEDGDNMPTATKTVKTSLQTMASASASASRESLKTNSIEDLQEVGDNMPIATEIVKTSLQTMASSSGNVLRESLKTKIVNTALQTMPSASASASRESLKTNSIEDLQEVGDNTLAANKTIKISLQTMASTSAGALRESLKTNSIEDLQEVGDNMPVANETVKKSLQTMASAIASASASALKESLKANSIEDLQEVGVTALSRVFCERLRQREKWALKRYLKKLQATVVVPQRRWRTKLKAPKGEEFEGLSNTLSLGAQATTVDPTSLLNTDYDVVANMSNMEFLNLKKKLLIQQCVQRYCVEDQRLLDIFNRGLISQIGLEKRRKMICLVENVDEQKKLAASLIHFAESNEDIQKWAGLECEQPIKQDAGERVHENCTTRGWGAKPQKLIEYLYRHRLGQDFLLIFWEEDDVFVHQQAAVNMAGFWADPSKKVGLEEVKLAKKVLRGMADKVGSGQVGWATINSFGGMARRDPSILAETRTSGGMSLLDRLAELVDGKSSGSLAYVRTLVLFYHYSYEKGQDVPVLRKEKELVEKVRELLAGAREQRARLFAAYLLHLLGRLDESCYDDVASIRRRLLVQCGVESFHICPNSVPNS